MMGPSSEALLRDAVVFYISSENRCARCYVPRINHDHRIHPQKKTREEGPKRDEQQHHSLVRISGNVISAAAAEEEDAPAAAMPKRATHGTRTGHK